MIDRDYRDWGEGLSVERARRNSENLSSLSFGVREWRVGEKVEVVATGERTTGSER